ncbi:Gfo/Idh/MocA family protein [Terriglobus roseus]|uniref:Predicted dehydrogenase n=1 Tax=Terriglobus roseus TaxID=392734 RepID=A0A1H4NDD6_9BACT|nr:Gfo/Idh/MocA family oxidoreductase [Terriglobus roseus]SEB93233.1 Predicted dehydrogenase [Terriglobus roseus]
MLRNIRAILPGLALLVAPFAPVHAQTAAGTPIRVAIVGLTHGHVKGFLHSLPSSTSAKLVAIVEPDQALAKQYATQYKLDPALFYTDEETMLNKLHPDAVLGYGTIAEHRKVIEIAANHGVNSMVEKPLTTTVEDALAIRKAAQDHHVQVLVNYETTWYNSNAEALKEIKDGKLGTVRKILVRDGHEGPKEIGVGPEWLPWLTDPKQNGAGALFDFGCYGADLATVINGGKTPLSVTAIGQTHKPDIYSRTEDDATVIVAYPGMQAILMPSWDWSFAVKNMEVYGNLGELFTVAGNDIVTRYKGEKTETPAHPAPALPQNQSNSLDYLAAVLHHEINPSGDLSSLETNVIVVQILDAARESIRSGKTVTLKPLPAR